MTSKDHKAWILPVGLAGELDTPVGNDAYQHVTETVQRVAGGSALKVNVTGPSATIADITMWVTGICTTSRSPRPCWCCSSCW